MPTRRQVLEQALVTERIHLWTDLATSLSRGAGHRSVGSASLVQRIRLIGEALGYPTNPRCIAITKLRWYRVVENVPELGLHAELPDDLELRWSGHMEDLPEDPDDALAFDPADFDMTELPEEWTDDGEPDLPADTGGAGSEDPSPPSADSEAPAQEAQEPDHGRARGGSDEADEGIELRQGPPEGEAGEGEPAP